MTVNVINIGQKLDREISLLLRHSSIGNLEFPMRQDLTYDEFLSDKMLIIRAIRAGIPYSLFELIQQDTPFSEDEWLHFLDITSQSLHHYRNASKHFNPVLSEKIIEIAEVTKEGLEVFEDKDKFKLWLKTPKDSMGNLKPIELLRDSYGKELVMEELMRLSEGNLA